MDKIKVYRIETFYRGPKKKYWPEIPSTAFTDGNYNIIEDTTTERICVCLTVPGCMLALVDLFATNKYNPGWVYEVSVPKNKLYRPTIKQLPDVQFTGERWLLEPTVFNISKLKAFHFIEEYNTLITDLYNKNKKRFSKLYLGHFREDITEMYQSECQETKIY